LPLEFGEEQRLLAALAEFGEVILHTGLDTPAPGLDTGTFLPVVRCAGLRYRRTADQRISTRRRELGEVLPDTRSDPAAAGFYVGTHLADVGSTSLARRTLLGGPAARRQQERLQGQDA
jgi:hypothetical protein